MGSISFLESPGNYFPRQTIEIRNVVLASLSRPKCSFCLIRDSRPQYYLLKNRFHCESKWLLFVAKLFFRVIYKPCVSARMFSTFLLPQIKQQLVNYRANLVCFFFSTLDANMLKAIALLSFNYCRIEEVASLILFLSNL